MKLGKHEMEILTKAAYIAGERRRNGTYYINHRYVVKCIAADDVPDVDDRGRPIVVPLGFWEPIDRALSAHLSRAARRLEQKGLVRFRRHVGGQINEIALTPAGLGVVRLQVELPHLLRLLAYYLGSSARVAETLGTSEPNISRWTRGGRRPADILATERKIRELIKEHYPYYPTED